MEAWMEKETNVSNRESLVDRVVGGVGQSGDELLGNCASPAWLRLIGCFQVWAKR